MFRCLKMTFRVTTFYKFVPLDDLATLRESLRDLGEQHGLCGTILIAPEGINATIAAHPPALEAFMDILRAVPEFSDMPEKRSDAIEQPFHRYKVRIKKEIVTMGVSDIDAVNDCGTHIEPADWNALIRDPEVALIDTRNDYEYTIGHFENSIDPGTRSFRQFPNWVEQNLDPAKHPKVAMYCTGGIRCEKATALLRKKGFRQVFHLKGGILKYLEEIPAEDSLWKGSCFVFDNRVGLGTGLEQSDVINCPGCRHPLTPEERRDPCYEEGVVCPHCATRTDEPTRARRRERHRQVLLAKRRGTRHLGSPTDIGPGNCGILDP